MFNLTFYMLYLYPESLTTFEMTKLMKQHFEPDHFSTRNDMSFTTNRMSVCSNVDIIFIDVKLKNKTLTGDIPIFLN